MKGSTHNDTLSRIRLHIKYSSLSSTCKRYYDDGTQPTQQPNDAYHSFPYTTHLLILYKNKSSLVLFAPTTSTEDSIGLSIIYLLQMINLWKKNKKAKYKPCFKWMRFSLPGIVIVFAIRKWRTSASSEVSVVTETPVIQWQWAAGRDHHRSTNLITGQSGISHRPRGPLSMSVKHTPLTKLPHRVPPYLGHSSIT